MRVWEGMEEDGIDHREYSSGGSNAEHQTENCRSRKTRILAHHADCKQGILPERFHRTPSSGKGTFETWCMFPAPENNRRSRRATVSTYRSVRDCERPRSYRRWTGQRSQASTEGCPRKDFTFVLCGMLLTVYHSRHA